jgi:hypothetical protein
MHTYVVEGRVTSEGFEILCSHQVPKGAERCRSTC